MTHGPLIHNAGVDKVDRHVQDAVKNGAKILIGGKRAVVKGNEDGAWYEPTGVPSRFWPSLPFTDSFVFSSFQHGAVLDQRGGDFRSVQLVF